MAYQVEIVEIPSTILAVVRQQTTWQALGNTIMASLNTVYDFLKTSAVPQQGHNVVVYLDDVPTIEVGVQVAAVFQSTGTVYCSTTPAGLAATTTHFGSYQQLPEAHTAIHGWGQEHGRALVRPCWEVYGDWRDDPTKVQTTVYY